MFDYKLKEFKLSKIPEFHPISQKYDRIQFWREHKRYCIEGKWSNGIWMPPELYYYVNFHNIKFEDDGGIVTSIGLPWLRDIEWDKAYVFSEACGFSGFELDKEYTCHRWYGPEKEIALSYEWITEKELNSKKYIPAREYLRKRHKKNLGKALYENSAKNVIDLESRGGGKSYWMSALILHNLLFDGARDYDKYLDKNTASNVSESVVGAIDTKYSNDLLNKVKTAYEYLPGSVSIVNVFGETETYPSPLQVEVTGSLAPNKFWQNSRKSLLHHRTFADNPLAANGTRPNRVFLDEVGFMGNIIEAWGAIESTQAAAQHKRLVIYAAGTGGLTSSGAALFAKEIFYNPQDYDCLVFEDTWENKGNIGYFLPATHTLNRFKKGENYITDETMALKFCMNERAKAEKSANKTRILTEMINRPIKPSEIFLRLEGNFFNITDLKNSLAELESNKRLLDASWKVDLELKDKFEVVAKPSNKHPLREFPTRKGSDLDAPIEIFEKPKLGDNNRPVSGRYIISNDPVDDDGNSNFKRSLQSAYVLDTWTDRIVAEYVARTYLAEHYYEKLRRLAIYYNARILYENNKKGLYGYFKNKNSLFMLEETPEILKETNLVKGDSTGNKALGVNMSSDTMKLMAINLLKSWLDKSAITNIEEEKGKKNVDFVRSPALLQELIAYSMDINADRVSAMLILMIYRADKERFIEIAKVTGNSNLNEVSKDKFWSKAYNQTTKTNHKGYIGNTKKRISLTRQ